MSELQFVNKKGNARFEEMVLGLIFGCNPIQTEHGPQANPRYKMGNKLDAKAHMLCTNQVYYPCLPYGRDNIYKPSLQLYRNKNSVLAVHCILSLNKR